MTSVARRYSKAAIAAAVEGEGEAGVEKLSSAIVAFRQVFDASAELRHLLAVPALKAEREAVLGIVLEKIGASATASKLVKMLAARGRIHELDSIANEIQNEADSRAGRLRAHVTSAMVLGDAHVQRLKAALHARFNREVVVDLKVNPELLGGLVCRVGDLTLDSSLSRQLELLREQVLPTV